MNFFSFLLLELPDIFIIEMDPSQQSKFMCKEEDEDCLREMTMKDRLKTEDESHSSDVAEDGESAFISVKEEPIDDVGTQNWSVDMAGDSFCSGVKEEPDCQETHVSDPLRAVTKKCRKDSGDGANLAFRGDSVIIKSLHKCPKCGAGFYSLEHLDNHMESHWKEKPYVCNYCWKPFATKISLTNHEKLHTEERRLCEKCGQTFSTKDLLSNHMRKHTGDEPYVCSHCGKKFTRNCYLTAHLKVHFKEQPLECKKCSKAFSYYASFMKHKQSHNKEKPFECSHCGKSFSQTPYLAQHMRVHMSK